MFYFILLQNDSHPRKWNCLDEEQGHALAMEFDRIYRSSKLPCPYKAIAKHRITTRLQGLILARDSNQIPGPKFLIQIQQKYKLLIS